MDFKAPIDITAVLTAVKKHKDILKAVDKLDASEVLRHFTPVPGITDSLELGKVEGGSISKPSSTGFTAARATTCTPYAAKDPKSAAISC